MVGSLWFARNLDWTFWGLPLAVFCPHRLVQPEALAPLPVLVCCVCKRGVPPGASPVPLPTAD